MSNGPQYLSVAELAERAGVSTQHVRNLIAGGQLKAVDVARRGRPVFRIPVADAERFLNRPAFGAVPTSTAA